jgi:uncharacterized short protein YbdD (DUF466 family)
MSAAPAVSCWHTAWKWLRRLSGDDAYERYRAHQAQQHPDAPLMNRREFCADEERRKWSGISRCC